MEAVAPSCVIQGIGTVVENVRIARDTFRIRLEIPEIARSIRPGQFVMIRPGGGATDPLLGRPFALYDVVRDTSGDPLAIDVVYLIMGRGTSALSGIRKGACLPIWGPLGNGFGPAPDPSGPVLFVAGGIGQTPFLALGRWWLGQCLYANETAGPGLATSVTLLYGVRTTELAAGIDDFKEAGIEVELATDDGSGGHHGYVTELLSRRLARGQRPLKIVGCGPPGMLASLASLVAREEIACDLSMENQMACGFGVCFSCVAPIRQVDGSVDLRRVCVEGPIFSAKDVDFSASTPH